MPSIAIGLSLSSRAVRILFVCLGNICRSPTAEGVMRSLVAEAGLAGEIEVDSAGTGDWHSVTRPTRAPPPRPAPAASSSPGRRARSSRPTSSAST